MHARTSGGLWLTTLLSACAGGGEDEIGSGDRCASSGSGTLRIEIEISEGVTPEVRVRDEEDDEAHAPLTGTESITLPGGHYRIDPRRVRSAGELVGPAYQGSVVAADGVCVRDGETATVQVRYTREPGSERLWLTQSNGSEAQVLSFSQDQLSLTSMQSPVVQLAPRLNSAGPLRVDGQGRLWIGSTSGKLVAYAASRLGTSSTSAPDIVLEGAALCEQTLPCGPRALAFDAEGGLWVATLSRIVRLSPSSLEESGEPSAEVTITSPDAAHPTALAFDAGGNLWVADADGGVVQFRASRLRGDIEGGAADVQLFMQQPGPVMIGLGAPEGLVFDADDNLWVGYFAGNDLVRLTSADRMTSAPEDAPRIPSVHIKIGVEALVTDLALDEAGNLWLPGGQGALYRIDYDQLSRPEPALRALLSDAIGSAEKLTFSSVPGGLFIAP